jgi:hypothetical protein
VAVVEEAVKHGADRSRTAQQLALIARGIKTSWDFNGFLGGGIGRSDRRVLAE